jgi:hypothetical protein
MHLVPYVDSSAQWKAPLAAAATWSRTVTPPTRTCTGTPPAPPASAPCTPRHCGPSSPASNRRTHPHPHAQGLTSARTGPAGLLRDLLDPYQLAPPATGSCSTSSTTARHGRRHNSTGYACT